MDMKSLKSFILFPFLGGKLVGETRNGTNLSGKAIEGGTAQKFSKGDFLIVPSGVAHQFVDITATYNTPPTARAVTTMR
ncbi:MAG: cupin domain-containing protein [Akkermansiaceae bacterium]|nr:cupin domain-containing protein [Akkermansiaceae bacterium]